MVKDIPKIELHVHLDGSTRIDTVREFLGSKEDIALQMVASFQCESLDDYLSKFSFPIKAMQTKNNLERIALELTEDLEKDHVLYAEVRFAPMFHRKGGLSMKEVVSSVLEGLSKGNVQTNLILCMMRGEDFQVNQEVIDVAYHFLGKGVCAVDLAGSEAKYPLSFYKDLFAYAKKKGVPFTIHAGENDASLRVKEAISFGASRIGHGISSVEDPSFLKELRKGKVLLEICPTSNVQTRAVSSYFDHPIRKFFDLDIPICINTDNRTVSHITLTEEYMKLMDTFHFTKEDFIYMNERAIDFCFLSKKEKEKLRFLFHEKVKDCLFL